MEPSTTFVVRDDGSTEVAIEGSLDGASGLFITSEPGTAANAHAADPDGGPPA